jgi:hypothetical protein
MKRSMWPQYPAMVVGAIGRTLWHLSNHRSSRSTLGSLRHSRSWRSASERMTGSNRESKQGNWLPPPSPTPRPGPSWSPCGGDCRSADEILRRIECDLHDGIQQLLVSLGLDLRATQAAVPTDLPELQARLDRVAEGWERRWTSCGSYRHRSRMHCVYLATH